MAQLAPDHPLYFEERSNEVFETQAAGQTVTIRADRMEMDGVTLRFIHPSKHARLEGFGISAPSTYITRGQTRTFRQYPKARNPESLSETSTSRFMDIPDIWNTI